MPFILNSKYYSNKFPLHFASEELILWTVIFLRDTQVATPTLVGEIDYVLHTTHILITYSVRNITHGPSPFSVLRAMKSWEGPGTRLCKFPIW